jgi:hypothetical protein
VQILCAETIVFCVPLEETKKYIFQRSFIDEVSRAEQRLNEVPKKERFQCGSVGTSKKLIAP